MSWFRRKDKTDDDQEQMLRQIASGGSPIVAPPTDAHSGAPQQFLPPPGQVAPGQVPVAQTVSTQSVSFQMPGFQMPGFQMPGSQMSGGIDLNTLLSKSIQAIGEHGAILRARGLDPDQLQRMLQQRIASYGTAGAGATAFVVDPAAAHPQADALVAELERLSHLHTSGSLSDEEFAEAKTKLLSAG